jgi:class 3 adenylate cyclase
VAEERKVVTVLFCDLVGFTARAEQLDPEEVRAVLRPYHDRVRSELERHGGTVEKFIGDAVMALFGAPTAHEDDPERAVRAALAVREFAVDAELELRIGITTGEALVSLGASPSEGEGMASGDVVNTAARLQSAAPVNGILADETTYRATRVAIDYAEAPAVEAKGKVEPIPVWEATAAHSRFGVDVTHHARAALVGREQELDFLRDAFIRVRTTRTPQLVTLVAVPGMGKSRLVYELSRIVDADPELIIWRQGRCLAYGDGVAFWALAEVVKAQAGILEQDTEVEAAEKLHSAVVDALADEGDARWIESHVRPLIGLETDIGLGGDRRGEAFAAWRRFLEALAEQRPLVLVLEDLHWADEGLLDFVDELVDWLSGVPLLVVCSARPELFERRPGWGGGKMNASTLGLSPLSSDQTALLISRVLERTLLPADIQQALLERSEGNPLYAEQFAQLYLERGSADDLPLPETLQGIVAARLDGLSTDEKSVLQDAAVVGKVFWTGALRREEQSAARLLHSLERKGFLTRQRRSSVESEGEWAFAHMLLRDVAYGQIPRGERSSKHLLAAEWIESLGRPEDHAELLAHHYLAALELSHAAGRDDAGLSDRARAALRAAGDRAFALSALGSASHFYAAALELWPSDDRDRPHLLLRYGQTGFDSAALVEASEALQTAGEDEAGAEAEASLAVLHWHKGDRLGCDEHLTRAASLVEESGPSASKAFVLSQLARYHMLAGRSEQAIAFGGEALEMSEELGLEQIRASVLSSVGVSRIFSGDVGGIADLERGIVVALAANSAECVRGYTNLASCLWLLGELARGWDIGEEGRQAARRFGDEPGLRFLEGHRVGQFSQQGLWDDCLQVVEAFLADSERSPHYLDGDCRLSRARIRLARDDVGGALEDVRIGVEEARRSGDPQALEPVLSSCAWILCEVGQTEEARPLFDESFTDAELVLLGSVLPLAAIALGEGQRVLAALERTRLDTPWHAAARALVEGRYEDAADIYEQIGDAADEAYARLRAAEALVEHGRRAEADEQIRRALAFFRSAGAPRYVREAQSLLAATA